MTNSENAYLRGGRISISVAIAHKDYGFFADWKGTVTPVITAGHMDNVEIKVEIHR